MYRGGRFLGIVSSALLIRILWAGPCIGIMGAVLVVFILSHKYSTILPGWPHTHAVPFFYHSILKKFNFFLVSQSFESFDYSAQSVYGRIVGFGALVYWGLCWLCLSFLGNIQPFSLVGPHTCRAFFHHSIF